MSYSFLVNGARVTLQFSVRVEVDHGNQHIIEITDTQAPTEVASFAAAAATAAATAVAAVSTQSQLLFDQPRQAAPAHPPATPAPDSQAAPRRSITESVMSAIAAAAPTSDIQALQQKHAQAVLIYHQTVEWEGTAWQQLQVTKASEQMQNMLVTAQAHLQEVARMTADAATTATALHHQLHQHQLMQLQDLQAQAAQQ